MFRKLLTYFKEVKVELTKVTWPSKDELLASTVIVIAISLAFSMFIFFADRGLNFLLGHIFKMK